VTRAGSIGPDFAAEAFSLTPDPGRLFLSHDHAEALAKLRRGIESRKGFVVLTAEVGLGKTTLTYSLLTALGPEVRSAYVANPRLDFEGLLRMALTDFGMPSEARTRSELLRALDELAKDCAASGQTAVLVIDEAQGLDQPTFESLLLLSSLQLVLVGQPELDEKLRAPELRAVAARVAVRIEIKPLDPAESREYVLHRLTKAGGSAGAFSSEALDVILRRAEGVPRRMNILCHNALLVAYASGADVVTTAMAEQAIEELTGGALVRLRSRPLTALEKIGPNLRFGRRARIGTAVVAVAAVAAIVWQARRPVVAPLDPAPRATVVAVQPAPECSQPVMVAIADPESVPSSPIVLPIPRAAPPPTIVVATPAIRATPSTTPPRAEPPAQPPIEVAIATPPPVEPPRAEPVPPAAERLPAEVPVGRPVETVRAEVAPAPQDEDRVAALAPTFVPPPATVPASGLTDAEVRAFIDSYARAWHRGDVGELRRIGQVADDDQAKALGKYFDSVRDFDVQVRIIEMEGSGDRRTVRFTRRDTFRDPAGRAVSKESPPIEKTIVRTPQGLKFAPRSWGGRRGRLTAGRYTRTIAHPMPDEWPPRRPSNDPLAELRELWESLRPKGGVSTPRVSPYLIALIGVLVWLASGIYIVAPDQRGLVLRFGKVVREVASGPHYHLPWPIERVLKPSVTAIRKVEVGFRTIDVGPPAEYREIDPEALMLTGDENIVKLEFIVQYRVRADATGVSDFLFKVRDPEGTLRAVAEAAMREVMGRTKIDDVLTEGKEVIQVEAQKRLQEVLNQYEVGIDVVTVKLQDVDPPNQVSDAFKDVISAQQDKERLINEAYGYANDVVPKARGQAAQLINEAEGFREARMREATGTAQRFIALQEEYAKAKDVTRRRLYLETIEEVLPRTSKIILDGAATKQVVPYLPLDQALRLRRPELPLENPAPARGR